ncbi:hypothetical protein PSYPI_42030, partial [Pseudomonas syringae pv. pisi str. 1704B]
KPRKPVAHWFRWPNSQFFQKSVRRWRGSDLFPQMVVAKQPDEQD